MGIFDVFKNLEPTKEEAALTIKNFNETLVSLDYFRTYLFQVSIISPNDEGNTFQCQWVANTATPVMVTSVQNIDYLHTQIKQSGKTTPQQWQVTVRDDASHNGAYAYFKTWKNRIYPYIKENGVSRYKRIAVIKMTPPSTPNKYREYTLYGVWPMEIQATTLDYESDGISTFAVTLSFDYYEAARKLQ
jgi:hypothetical protein